MAMDVRVVSETATTVTIGWSADPGALGYLITLDGQERLTDGKRHFTWNASQLTARIGKPQDGAPHSYGVVSLRSGDSGSVTVPRPPLATSISGIAQQGMTLKAAIS